MCIFLSQHWVILRLVLRKVIAVEASDSVTGTIEDEQRARQYILSTLRFVNLADTQKGNGGSEVFWLYQSINHLEIAKFKLVTWFLIFQT